ncbi:MAG: hypothetical protein LBC64_05000 [Fibromonadaceae bacterium]|jgi:uncharacterized protein (TIGR02145 family)|nr:hypothetical protein [Fibromonadaceae bacterium]
MNSKLTKLALTAALALAITLSFTQKATAENPPEKAAAGTFTDIRDKKAYKTVKIGKQTWMAENLNFEAKDSKCYDNKPDNCKKYGRLYDWKTAMKACPSGWYLPSEADWDDLILLVNPSCPLMGDCADAGAKLKAASGWNGDGNGTDNYGFTALPGGVGLSASKFRDAGNGGLWWSSSDDAKKASRISIDINGPDVHRNSSDKNLLFSIRCLQEAPIQTNTSKLLESIIDGNGNVKKKFEYDKQNRIVKIDGETITYADNLITVGTKKFVIKGNTVTIEGGSTFTINKDGYITNVGDEKTFKYKNGNLIEKEYPNPADDVPPTYVGRMDKYDDKKSPFTNCKTPKWLLQGLHILGPYYVSKNNVLREIVYGRGTTTTVYKYKYDSYGFPELVEEAEKYENDSPTITVTRYTYLGN